MTRRRPTRTDDRPSDGQAERSRSALSKRGPSRRTVLRLTGAVAAPLGLGTVTASGSDGDSADVAVTVTDPYRAAVQTAAHSVAEAGVDVAISDAEGAPADEPSAVGDVHVSGRPTTADGSDSVRRRDVVLLDRAALDTGALGWCDCLRPGVLGSPANGDGSVELWREVLSFDAGDATAIDGTNADTTLDDIGPVPLTAESDTSARDVRSRRGPVLVRGSRRFQYAAGRGGIGYYRVDRSALGPLEAERKAGHIDLVRLAVVRIPESSSEERSVRLLIEALRKLGPAA